MNRAALERHQVWLYLVAIALGFVIGRVAPGMGGTLGGLVWPVLGLLLFATFVQTPLEKLPEAIRDARFAGAALTGNFVLVPLLVWALLPLLTDDPAIRLGVLLVLLVPCTDWFVTFTHLAGGDTRRAVAITPLNLVLQFLLLPLYLWLFLGEAFGAIISPGPVMLVFGLLIVLPLGAAFLLQRAARRSGRAQRAVDGLGGLAVPLLALVLVSIAASEAEAIADAGPALLGGLPVFLAFLAGAGAIGLLLTRAFGLGPVAGRALVFSLSTRNSFVVLPFALALPMGLELAAMVIVFQSLVELLTMVLFLVLVPKLLPAGGGEP